MHRSNWQLHSITSTARASAGCFSPLGPLGMKVPKNLVNSSDDFRDSIFRTREIQQVISPQNGPIRAQRCCRTHCGVGQLS